MTGKNPWSFASIGGGPLHALLVPFPLVCFVGAFVSDVVYWQSANMMWANFSAWLLAVGLIIAIFVVITGLIDFVANRQVQNRRAAWIHVIGNLAAIILSIINSFVHSRDAYTSVVPTGLALSGIVVLILLVTSWNGWTMVYRHSVGVVAGGDQ
ncbi:MAG TPA: DUF2231 domain-containing protein [Afipia sp.]